MQFWNKLKHEINELNIETIFKLECQKVKSDEMKISIFNLSKNCNTIMQTQISDAKVKNYYQQNVLNSKSWSINQNFP